MRHAGTRASALDSARTPSVTDEFRLDETDLEIPCPTCATEMVKHDSTEFLEETPEGAILECGACGGISTWQYSLQPRRVRHAREKGEARELPSQALPAGLRYVESPREMMMLLFLYGTLVQFRNRTTIRATRTSLIVEHGPLPWSWPRRRELPLDDVVEVECLERRRWFSLAARTRSRNRLVLKSIIAEDAGDFIARRVNRFIEWQGGAPGVSPGW